MQTWEESALRERLTRCIQTGRLDGLEIEYWIGGGQPPPFYRSDQFRLLTVDGRELIELARPIFDESFQPYPVDKRQLPASRDDVATIAEAVKRLYEDPPEPAEVPPDALRAEVLVTEGDRQSTLVMLVPVPPRAQSLHDAVTPRVARLAATEGGVYHEGKRIR